MSKATPATKFLDRLKVEYSLHSYNYDASAQFRGIQAAEEMGVSPECVLKTIMVLVDGKPACVVVPADREISMKKLAAAFGGKSAKMMSPEEAEKQTAYKVGGISPFGRKRESPVAVEELVMSQDKIFVNGGQRGLQICLAPQKLVEALHAKVISLVNDRVL